jgi:hypothetical protein
MGYDQRCEAYSHAAATVNTKLVLALKTEKLFPRKGAKAQRNPLERGSACALAPLRGKSLRLSDFSGKAPSSLQ